MRRAAGRRFKTGAPAVAPARAASCQAPAWMRTVTMLGYQAPVCMVQAVPVRLLLLVLLVLGAAGLLRRPGRWLAPDGRQQRLRPRRAATWLPERDARPWQGHTQAPATTGSAAGTAGMYLPRHGPLVCLRVVSCARTMSWALKADGRRHSRWGQRHTIKRQGKGAGQKLYQPACGLGMAGHFGPKGPAICCTRWHCSPLGRLHCARHSFRGTLNNQLLVPASSSPSCYRPRFRVSMGLAGLGGRAALLSLALLAASVGSTIAKTSEQLSPPW